MKKVSIYKYYSFGFNYYGLKNDANTWTNSEYKESLEAYMKLISELDLRVTKVAVESLELDKMYDELKKLSLKTKTRNSRIEQSLHGKIEDAINKIDLTLDSEICLRHAFILGEKRWSTEILMNRIDKLFANEVYSKLPDVAKDDFKEAGMCYALDRNTACAFHALRGTEDILSVFYQKLTGNVLNGTETWGKFVHDIQNGITLGTILPGPSEELMINLDNLRKYYRNKTQHPQLIYSSDEAHDLLSHCVKSVNQIVKDLMDRSLI